MYLGENNDNLSETKRCFLSARFQPFLKMRKFLLDMRKDFFIMSNFCLVEILSEPNSLTIVTSKKILIMSNYVLILSIFFLITRIRNSQCTGVWYLINNSVTSRPEELGALAINWIKVFLFIKLRRKSTVLCFERDLCVELS